jgi:hypothetical protein
MLGCVATQVAYAALGEEAASVNTDIARMKGQARATAIGGYTVEEITLPSGTILREYVSAEGMVFAVTWDGMTLPDLHQTLGTYFEDYKLAADESHDGHHNLSIDESDFVMSIGGHMRAWYGKAYVPKLLPPNLSPEDLQ